jgi:spore germination protein GerM
MMRRVWIGAALLAVLAWAVWRAQAPSQPGRTGETRPDTLTTGLHAARLFFASPAGDSLMSESRDLLDHGTLHERVAALVAELERGPHGAALTVLPAGTAVLNVYLDDRGLMTLDLSREFVTGFHGGSNAEYFAVASLIRTVGANVPEVKRVLLVCGGEPLPTLGGHLPLDQPFDVQDWP